MVNCLAILLAATCASPQSLVLDAESPVWDVETCDINGDGLADILAVCCEEDVAPLHKTLAAFIASGRGAYPSKPTAKLELESRTGVLFCAEVDGTPPVEVVVTTEAGAAIYQYKDKQFSVLHTVPFASLLPSGSREPCFIDDVAADLDGDGRDEWFIPVSGGFEIREPDKVLTEVDCDVVSEARHGSGIVISHRLPAYKPFDIGGEKNKGVVFLSDEYADIVYGESWQQHKRFKIPINLDDKWEASAQTADIDGNGLPDLVVTQMRGTTKLEVLTQVYLATPSLDYPAEPTASFAITGAITSPVLKDANGDGKIDLIFINVPFGLKFLVNYFVLSRMAVQLDVYQFHSNGFRSRPDFTHGVTIDAPEGRETAAYTFGDFNGDGRLDVAFGQGAEKLVVHVGQENGFLSAKPRFTFRMPTFGSARAVRLDSNNADDLILFHPGLDNNTRIDAIVF